MFPMTNATPSVAPIQGLQQAADLIKAATAKYGPSILEQLGLPGAPEEHSPMMGEEHPDVLSELMQEFGDKGAKELNLPGVGESTLVPTKGETVIEVEIEPKDVHDQEVKDGEEKPVPSIDSGSEGVDAAFERYINKKKLGIEE